MSAWHDVRFTVRVWRRAPIGPLACVLMLAIGLASATVTVSAIQTITTNAIPFREPDRLVQIFQRFIPRAQMDRMSVSPANYRDWQAARSFASMAAYRHASMNASGGAGAERLRVVQTTAELFALLDVSAAVGRGLEPGDDEPTRSGVAVISASLWGRRFAGDPAVVGQTLVLNGRGYTVVGIMPPRFRFPIGWTTGDTEVWIPLQLTPAERDQRQQTTLEVVARLAAGVTVHQAQSEMDGVTSALERQHPATNTGWASNVLPLAERIRGGLGRTLTMLGLAVVLVLIIMCVNVANLLLARGAERRNELVVRTALGADRRRLLRQLMTEGLLLAWTAASAGLVIAAVAIPAIAAVAPAGQLRELREMTLGPFTVLATYALAVVVGAGCSVVPAMTATGRGLRTSLSDHGRTGDGGGLTRLKSGLLVAELALAAAVMICASSVFASFRAALSVDAGFDASNALTFRVSLPAERYQEPHQWTTFFERLESATSGVVGVQVAALGSGAPMDGGGAVYRYRVLGVPPPAPGERLMSAEFMRVSPGYFEAAGIRLLQGRPLTPQDGRIGRVAIVNDAFVRRLPPDLTPVGAQLVLQGDLNRSATPVDMGGPLEVVGVVAATRHYATHLPATPMIYVPLVQDPVRTMSVVVRSQTDPTALLPQLRRVLAELDPEVPMFGVRTLEDVVRGTQAMFRVNAWVFTALGVVAWVVSTIGIYGLFANAVARRQREFGVRAALGAAPRRLIRMVMAPALWMSVCGLGAGAALSVPALNFVAIMLKQSMNLDLVPNHLHLGLVVGATVLCSAAGATLRPALRAARVNPAAVWR